MPVVACSHCGARLEAPPDLLGKAVTCSSCHQVFTAQAAMPGAATPGTVPPPPAAAPPIPEWARPQVPGTGNPGAGTPGATWSGPAYYVQRPERNGMAVASMVLGICSIPTCLFYGVPSLVCGILAVAFHQAAKKNIAAGIAGPTAAGMAQAGLICGIIGIVLSFLFWLCIIAGLAFGIHHGMMVHRLPYQ